MPDTTNLTGFSFPTPADLQAQAGAMTSDSIARQLGELACGKTQAEANAMVWSDQANRYKSAFEQTDMALHAQSATLGARLTQLEQAITAAGLTIPEWPSFDPAAAADGLAAHPIDHAEDAPPVPPRAIADAPVLVVDPDAPAAPEAEAEHAELLAT